MTLAPDDHEPGSFKITPPPRAGVRNEPLPSGGRHTVTYYLGLAVAAAAAPLLGLDFETALLVVGPVAGALGGLWRRWRDG